MRPWMQTQGAELLNSVPAIDHLVVDTLRWIDQIRAVVRTTDNNPAFHAIRGWNWPASRRPSPDRRSRS